MTYIIPIVYLIVFIIVPDALSQNKKVAVYYEALCPDSRNFVLDQLAPNYNALVDKIDLQLVPYGNAIKHVNQKDGTFSFQCQHGEQECLGNKLHSCIIEKYFENQEKENKLKTVELIDCAFLDSHWHSNVTQAVDKCYVKVFKSDFTEITKCASERGNDLLNKMANETNQLSPHLNWVPWITVNNVRVEAAEKHFLKSVSN